MWDKNHSTTRDLTFLTILSRWSTQMNIFYLYVNRQCVLKETKFKIGYKSAYKKSNYFSPISIELKN